MTKMLSVNAINVLDTRKTIVFLDNKFPSFFSQIDYLFTSGFLPENTEIIARFRIKNWRSILLAAKKHRISVKFYHSLRGIPAVPDNSIVIYPYNAQTNMRMLLNRSCTHVFVGHGDSNKKASCNPMVRAYDFVLIAGKLSKQRLISSGILRPYAEKDHTICVGNSVIDMQHASTYRLGTAASGAAIGYFPTWEGGFDGENYSSIAEPNTADCLIAIANTLNSNKLIFDLHPNIGERLPTYQTALRNVILKLLDAKIEVSIRRKSGVGIKTCKPLCDLLRRGQISYCEQNVELCYAAVDVSATEGIVTSQKIPSVILWRDSCKMYASEQYRGIRSASLVRLSDNQSANKIASYINTSQSIRDQNEFETQLFSYSDDAMVLATPAQRWELLCDKYFRNPTLVSPDIYDEPESAR